MSDFGEMVNSFGWPGAMLILLITVLILAFRKLNQLGTPFILSQIEFTKSQKESTESQAKSIEILAHSFKAIENSTKMMAVGISQILDAGDGVTKNEFDALEFKFRKLEEHTLMQDTALGLKPHAGPESITDPKLKMEPMQTHAEKQDMKDEIQDLKDELKEPEDKP